MTWIDLILSNIPNNGYSASLSAGDEQLSHPDYPALYEPNQGERSFLVQALTKFTAYVLDQGRIVENLQDQGGFLVSLTIFLATLLLMVVSTWVFSLKTSHEFDSYRRQLYFSPDQIPRDQYGGIIEICAGYDRRTPFGIIGVHEEEEEEGKEIDEVESELGCMEYTE